MVSTAPLEVLAPTESGQQRRIEGALKVTGQMPYAADLHVEGTLFAAVLRSPHPHARILSIDASQARAMPGVAYVLTGADVSHIRTGRGVRDVPLLAIGKTRFVGKMVAAVAAENRDIAEQAVSRLQVEYETLPAVFDPRSALEPGAMQVHAEPWTYAGAARDSAELPNVIARTRHTRGGDVELALRQSDRYFEHTFVTPSVHQGYIEPHCCTVSWDGAGLRIWSCNKSPYALRDQLAGTFDVPPEDVRIHTFAVGGDFGGKGSPMDIPLSLELSRRTGRPIRMHRTYDEELIAGDPAMGMDMAIRMGVRRDGRIQALSARTLLNAGAYGGFTPGVASRVVPATGYRLPVAEFEMIRVYTNQVPNGNMRAPGCPQTVFGIEAMMDLVARELQLDPFEFRRRNLLQAGETSVNGDVWPEQRGLELLNAAEHAAVPVFPPDAGPNHRFGRGMAIFDRPTHPSARTSLRLLLAPGGCVEAQVPKQETGTGPHSMIQRALASLLGLDRQRIMVRYVGTSDLPYDVGVGGQRVTVTAIEACAVAAKDFRKRLTDQAAQILEVDAADLQLDSSGVLAGPRGRHTSLEELSARGLTVEVTAEVEEGAHDAGSSTYCVQVARVGVDTETGQVTVHQLVSAHDVAEIIEPVSHRGQIEGGVAMGLGFALSEDLALVDGRVTAAHLGDYKMPTIEDMPPLEVVLLKGGKGVGPLNVKSIGEMPNVPTAPAIANAVADALGVCMDSLPLTSEKVLAAVRNSPVPGKYSQNHIT